MKKFLFICVACVFLFACKSETKVTGEVVGGKTAQIAIFSESELMTKISANRDTIQKESSEIDAARMECASQPFSSKCSDEVSAREDKLLNDLLFGADVIPFKTITADSDGKFMIVLDRSSPVYFVTKLGSSTIRLKKVIPAGVEQAIVLSSSERFSTFTLQQLINESKR